VQTSPAEMNRVWHQYCGRELGN